MNDGGIVEGVDIVVEQRENSAEAVCEGDPMEVWPRRRSGIAASMAREGGVRRFWSIDGGGAEEEHTLVEEESLAVGTGCECGAEPGRRSVDAASMSREGGKRRSWSRLP